MRRLAALALLATTAAAQPSTEADRGADAYRQGQYAEAVRLLDRAVEAAPASAETHYLLARVLYDRRNPDRSESRAGREIERAVDLDPGNLVYLVAQLEQLRGRASNTIQELYRLRRRALVAGRILEIDSTNAYAHEEVGVQAIYDYYQYRNAIKLPGLSVGPADAGRSPIDASGRDPADEGNTVGLPQPLDPDTPAVSAYERGGDEAFFQGALGEAIDNRFDLALLQREGVMVTDFGDRAQNAYDRAVLHLRQSLASDPRRRDVYDHVARLAVLSGEYQAAVPDLAEMYVQFPDDPAMWLYTGLVNHRLGQYPAAAAAFRQALERMDEPTRAAFTDLTLILPPGEWNDFRADPDAFADRYWASRDPRFLNDANERRTEHYSRLVTADLLYRSDDLDLPGWKTERGQLHVRYGPPALDVVIDGSYGNVVERYTGRDAAFVQSEVAGAANRFNVWDYGDGVQFVFEDPIRNGEFTLYAPPADVYAIARNPGRMDFVLRAAEEVRRRPERYDFHPPGREVELPYRVAAFKGADGQTDLYVNYGIPVGESGTPGDGVQADVDVTVRTGAFLVGPNRELLVERRRTVYGLRGAQIVPFDGTRLWTSTEEMTARPGPHEVSLEFETASGQTSAVQRRAVDVPSFAGDRLQLSDVLLAYAVEEADRADPGRVFRNGISVQPAPWGVFGIGDPIYLYVEAYGLGLAAGRSDYEVEASLRPKDTSRGVRRLARRIFGGDGTAVSAAFEAQGSRPDDAIYLFLDATGQERGLYTLTVTVRDRVTGTEADQETDLFLE